jgi:hypothetical protein
MEDTSHFIDGKKYKHRTRQVVDQVLAEASTMLIPADSILGPDLIKEIIAQKAKADQRFR